MNHKYISLNAKQVDVDIHMNGEITRREQEEHNKKYHLISFHTLIKDYTQTTDHRLNQLQENTMFEMLLQSQLNNEESRERLKIMFRNVEVEDRMMQEIRQKRLEREEIEEREPKKARKEKQVQCNRCQEILSSSDCKMEHDRCYCDHCYYSSSIFL